MRRYKKMALFCAVALMLSGCSQTSGVTSTQLEESSTDSTASDSTTSETTVTATSIDPTELFSDRDYEIDYDETTSAQITLNGTSATCTSNAVTISERTITISDEGTYVLTGTLENGIVIVEAEDSDKVQLVLNGVSITNESSASIYIKEADKVFITTNADTTNTLSNGGTYTNIDDNNIDSVIFSKADLTLNGAGTLSIDAEAGHGIVSKDDVIITSGTYTITAASHGISGKDRIGIADGTFTIESGKDGIHAENADDASLGYIYVADGIFDIKAQGDGISAENTLQVENGTFQIQTGEGSAAVTLEQNNTDKSMREHSATSTTTQSSEQTTATEDTSVSMKGLKAASDLVINGGTFAIDTEDDALHSNANMTVNSGDFQIATGDDGMHADDELTIADGSIQITKSYEGLEGQSVTISGGEIHLVASDDGVNAAGGNDQSGTDTFAGGRGGGDQFASDDNAMITISGGILYVNADGDGIDSNGSMTISGGEVYVLGPSNSGNGAIDYDAEATITGGTFIAVGSSQMAQNFSDSSTQGAILVSVGTQESGSVIKLMDQNKNELLSWTADKSFDSVLISCSEIQKGSSYIVSVGTSETEVTMDSLIYETGNAGGRGMGNKSNGRGRKFDETQSTTTENDA